MMRALAGFLVLSLLGAAAPDGPVERFAAVDRAVEAAMESHRVLGVSVAIIDNFEVVHARGFGFAEPGRPADANTLFQAASLSKPV